MNQIKLMADKSAHLSVQNRLMKDYPLGGQGLSVMDAPCGAGAMSAVLKEMGFDVSCYDIDSGNFGAAGLGLVVQEADLNRRLSIADEQFDAVVSIAGIQRLFNPENALLEFNRVLKAGGTLYLSCPNFSNLNRRMNFLLSGSLGLRFDRPSYNQTLDNPEANVRMPITLSRVQEILASSGFEIEAVEGSYDQLYPWLLLPLTMLVMLAGWLRILINPRRYACYSRGNSLKMLSSKNFLVVCRKRV